MADQSACHRGAPKTECGLCCHVQYVQFLRRSLKEHIETAQASASKQLKRHTELYNRKVRGAPVTGVSDLPGSEGGPLPWPVSVGFQSHDPQQPDSELGNVVSAQGDSSCAALADVAGSNDHIPTLHNAAPVPPVEPSCSIRSSTGRLLRPVTRLIEIMDQRMKTFW